ncbi:MULTISPECIES: ATP-binding cassette domain-containing protein [Streptacidiphilus]|uniref:ATP-binding cassette domain-containing protein n=1 Tax=Streptacidiphilus cavernicola TaxID=3342716 RepID=A0ABV6UIK3_9ACTN|nr:ATP-binding cassette domain-containing protein [Streptacidiphilus jeojiense]
MTLEIALLGARVRHGPLEALHGVDLPVPAGRLTVLLGRNGAGRSTALDALAGAVPLSAGRVHWYGGAPARSGAARDITALGAYARARRGMTLVPAEGAVFPSLTVADHLSRSTPRERAAVLDLFPELGRLLPRSAGTLSGGEQQMLALGVALARPSRLLMLDEPGRGLAPAVLERLHTALAAQVAAGRTVVLAEQSLPSEATAAVDLVHVLHRGSVIFSGEPGEPGLAAISATAAPSPHPAGPGPGRWRPG